MYNVGAQEGWKLVKPIPYTKIYKAATKTRNINFSIGFLFLLLAVVLVTYFSNADYQAAQEAFDQMRRFSSGETSKPGGGEGKR